MKLSVLFGFAALLALSSSMMGCSGNDGAIAVDPATTPLTTQANDALFTVRVTEARDDGYALTGIVVKAIPEGKDAITLSCATTDKNTNSKLDKDDSLVCNEGATNVFDATFAGNEIPVELYAQVDGKETRIGDAKWTVAK
jgi:hypothetical protein